MAVLFIAVTINAQSPGVAVGGSASASAGPSSGLAVVDGQTITIDQIDAKARTAVEGLAASIVDARRSVLDNLINSVLLEAAARKRQMASWQLYDIEVTRRMTAPTEREIKQLYEDNRAQMGSTDLETARPQLVLYLRRQQEQDMAASLVAKVRAGNAITMRGDVNASFLAPGAVLATVAGQNITARMLEERLKPVVHKLKLNAYQLEKAAVDRTINDMLLLAEAQKRNVGPEVIIRTEVTEKVHHPTDADVAKYYEDNKAQIKGGLEAHKAEIAAYLDQVEQTRVETAMNDLLRAKSNIRYSFSEPVEPVLSINTEGGATRGDSSAPVTVVEFTDFQCPACGKMYPVLEEALKPYSNQVRFVVRNFPLDMHANARRAAEAASAAKAQGKFFEYIALLFTNQEALDEASLKKYATMVGLDRARFDAALATGEFSAIVRKDMEDGLAYGVGSTPTIFINGLQLREFTVEGIKAAIDQELAKAAQSNKKAAR
jgi:predicted DsbA family dithiol-disulfide isomerase